MRGNENEVEKLYIIEYNRLIKLLYLMPKTAFYVDKIGEKYYRYV